MRLLIVGSDKVYAIENFYVKYLKEAGVELQLFPAPALFYDYYQQGIVNKLIFKAGLSGIVKQINSRFRQTVDQFRPDLIWVFKGMEISPESLLWAKNKGIKLLNYNPDNPFIFTGSGSGNQYVTDAIHLYDLHFTYNLEILERLRKEYHCQTAYLPFGFDISNELYGECATQAEINKVCFLGNPDSQRAGFIRQLIENNIAIDVFGNNWSKFISSNNVTVHAPVYGDELWKVLRRYRAQLNMMRIHNENSHNMRSFEVPGVGGIMIAPKTTEHEMFFENGKEVFLYTDAAGCAAAMRDVLSLSDEQSNEIRLTARNTSIDKGYSYKDRALSVLDVIKKL